MPDTSMSTSACPTTNEESLSSTLRFVHRWEGGYVNNPNDRGGATNMGVTQATYDAWRKKKGQVTQSVKSISEAEVQEIFYENYWRVAHCDELEWPLNLAAGDTAFNSGPKRAIKLLQQAVGADADGVWGPNTRAKASSADKIAAFKKYVACRKQFYQQIVDNDSSQQVFLKGWNNRANSLERYGLSAGVSFDLGGLDLSSINPDNEPSAKAIVIEDSDADGSETTSGGIVQKVLNTMGRIVDNITTVEVRTYTAAEASTTASDFNGRLRAVTRIAADGDTFILAPMNSDGAIDMALWQIHTAAVEQAQKRRGELLRETLEIATTVLAKLK